MGNMYCEMCKRNQPPGFFCPACGKKLVRVQDTGSDLSKIDAGHVIEISDDDTMYKCFERDALFSDIEHGSPPFHNSQPYFPKLFDKYVLGVSPKDFPSNVNPDNYVHTSCAKCGEVTFVHSSFRDFSIPEKDGAICLECRKKLLLRS